MVSVPINHYKYQQFQQYFFLPRLILLILVYKRLEEALSSTLGYSSNTNGKGSGTTTATEQQKEYFTYDPVGNRLISDTYSAYTYNQANQLLTNGGTYSYDKNGNLTSKIDGTTTYNYSYDYENHLTKVVKTEDGSTTTSEYKYDPFGRRIEKKVTESGATTTTKYVYDNEDIILEYDGSGNTGNRYVHGPGIDEPLAVINGKNTYYYHADGLGSIVALTDSSGKTQQTYEYDSFGNLKDQKNKVKQPYTFTGREWDKEAGLYYLRARYYDAKVGRFIQKDRFSGHLRKPITKNRYLYTSNNPANWFDPYGLWDYATEYGTTGEGLTENMTNIENSVDEIFNEVANRDAVVTYTTNGTHSSGSLHYSGNAVDLRARDLSNNQRQCVTEHLRDAIGSDYDVINEGDHIHVEYDP